MNKSYFYSIYVASFADPVQCLTGIAIKMKLGDTGRLPVP
jgi:hypothetical protein